MARRRGKRSTEVSEDTDGCDLDFRDDPTSDADLPAASGGVQQAADSAYVADHDHTDGCDLDFDDDAVTEDEDLPVATGGTA